MILSILFIVLIIGLVYLCFRLQASVRLNLSSVVSPKHYRSIAVVLLSRVFSLLHVFSSCFCLFMCEDTHLSLEGRCHRHSPICLHISQSRCLRILCRILSFVSYRIASSSFSFFTHSRIQRTSERDL